MSLATRQLVHDRGRAFTRRRASWLAALLTVSFSATANAQSASGGVVLPAYQPHRTGPVIVLGGVEPPQMVLGAQPARVMATVTQVPPQLDPPKLEPRASSSAPTPAPALPNNIAPSNVVPGTPLNVVVPGPVIQEMRPAIERKLQSAAPVTRPGQPLESNATNINQDNLEKLQAELNGNGRRNDDLLATDPSTGRQLESDRLEQNDLFRLKMAEKRAIDTVGPGHPAAVRVRKQIELLEKQIATVRNAEHKEAQNLDSLDSFTKLPAGETAPASSIVQQSGPVNQERPQQDRPQQDRPQQDRPQQDRPQQDRPQQDRPQQDRPQQERSLQGRALQELQERRRQDRGPQDRGPQDRGPQDRGPQDRGPQERGPQERGPQERGPQERGPQERGPQDRGPQDRGPQERGNNIPRQLLPQPPRNGNQPMNLPIGPRNDSIEEQLRIVDRVFESPMFKRYLELMEQNAQLRAQVEFNERMLRSMRDSREKNGAHEEPRRDHDEAAMREMLERRVREVHEQHQAETRGMRQEIEKLEARLREAQAALEKAHHGRESDEAKEREQDKAEAAKEEQAKLRQRQARDQERERQLAKAKQDEKDKRDDEKKDREKKDREKKERDKKDDDDSDQSK